MKSPRYRTFCLLAAFAVLPAVDCMAQTQDSGSKADAAKPIRVLIVDGQNGYHGDWPKITAMMKSYLLETGKFEVDVYRSKFTMNGALVEQFPLDDGKEYQDFKEAKTDPDFKPDFSKYDVVVNNFGFGAAPWPEETRAAFVDFMKNGGGLVSVHAADNCFPDWKEYNLMTGLGGWGGRNEKSGPYVYYNEAGEIIRDESAGGGGGHGPQHEYEIVIRDDEHPITKGLPGSFLHAQDELYERLRGPALHIQILATAFASPEKKGSGRHEPILMVIDYQQGRTFHTTLGHAAYSCECVGFITTFLRGTEWAATGNVTIPVPVDFPSADKSSVREFEQQQETVEAK